MSHLGVILARLGGANTNILDQVPEERSRFIQMGLVLLSTAGLATLSMTYAVIDGLRAPLLAAIALGLVWGAIILNLDRMLILFIKPTGSKLRLLGMVAPRLVIAMLLGLVIATPLTLRIFQSEIAARMILDNAQQAIDQSAKRAQDPRVAELAAVNSDIKRYEDALAGRVQFSSPNLAQIQAEATAADADLQAKQDAYSKAYREWRCELLGEKCPGTTATGDRGNGARAQADKEQADAAAAALATAQQIAKTKRDALAAAQDQNIDENATKLAQAQAEANAQLPAKRAKRAELEQALSGVTASDSGVLAGNTGLLARIEALNRLGEASGSARLAHLAVAGLLFMIELLPVLVKTLSIMGPPTVYERVNELNEKSRLDDATQKRSGARRRRTQGADKEEAIEADMVAREINLGKRANAHVEREMTKILDVALTKWSDEVARTLHNQSPHPPTSPPQSGRPTGGHVPLQRQSTIAGLLAKFNLPPRRSNP